MSTIPTIGFNVETVQYKNISFSVWDVGGQGKEPYTTLFYTTQHYTMLYYTVFIAYSGIIDLRSKSNLSACCFINLMPCC